MISRGESLTDADYQALAKRWITREDADGAHLRRVASSEGAEIVGRTGRAGDYAGILIPYLWPGEAAIRDYRLRRDHPEMEQGRDGTMKPRAKYLSPPGRGNMVYLSPQTGLPLLSDTTIPAVVVEGEFKTIALWRLAWHGLGDAAETPAFLPIGLQGVWSWRGTIGKTEDEEGVRVDVKGPVPDLSRVRWDGRRVIILFDADVATNPSVAAGREELARELVSRGARVAYFPWPTKVPDAQKGIDDFLAVNGPEPVLRLLVRAKERPFKRVERVVSSSDAARGGEQWKDRLITGDRGIKPLLANAMTALRFAPEWREVLAFNEMSRRTEVVGGSPWKPDADYLWSDNDDVRFAEWLQWRGIEVNVAVANLAAESVARERGYHPIQQYLKKLDWDGKPRIDEWLIHYLMAPDTPYVRAVAAKWLISGVARVMEPGCQADYTLIFQGEQRSGKSTALRTLAVQDRWFTDDVQNPGTKEAAQQLLGIWIVELGELTQIVGRAAEMEVIKGWLTRRWDHYRPPYGRRADDFPRQCVFAGTTNAQTYFRDETGNERFWPVPSAGVRLEGLRDERDQLWAEARVRYELAEHWWLEEASVIAAAKEEQDARFQVDPWDKLVWDYAEVQRSAWEKEKLQPLRNLRLTMDELLEKAIKKDRDQWSRQDSTRICAIMRHRGFEYVLERVYDYDDKPVLGPGGKPLRERRFRWPQLVTPPA